MNSILPTKQNTEVLEEEFVQKLPTESARTNTGMHPASQMRIPRAEKKSKKNLSRKQNIETMETLKLGETMTPQGMLSYDLRSPLAKTGMGMQRNKEVAISYQSYDGMK